jgi:hypothetical protein
MAQGKITTGSVANTFVLRGLVERNLLALLSQTNAVNLSDNPKKQPRITRNCPSLQTVIFTIFRGIREIRGVFSAGQGRSYH